MNPQLFKTLFPRASKDTIKANCPAVPGAWWSKTEDDAIRSFYAAHQAGDRFVIKPLSESLGRSPASIHCRANELGITFERGKYPRSTPKIRTYQRQFKTAEELHEYRSEKMKERHRTTPHPMKGKPVPRDVKDRISKANIGRKRPPEATARQMRTRQINGTMIPNKKRGSWRAGWREIGGQKIYARSMWEANYARYLELLKKNKAILDWQHEPDVFWFEKILRGVRCYIPDFRVLMLDQTVEYHEVKGWMDAKSKTKIRRMGKYHPTVTVKIINGEWFRANTRQMRSLIADWETK
jgi:hypothetical protein